MSRENPRFFIAYAHSDNEHFELFLKLFAESKPSNWEVWSDSEVPIGNNWPDLIKKELASADYIIVLLSTAFSTSAFAKNEILFTFERSKIIPILLKPYQYNRDSFFAESQVFLYARKNANSISFEEWLGLSSNSNDTNGTFSNSFTMDLIAFIKDGNAELLIGEEMYYKTGKLHLNNCGLREWPAHVFQMTWLTLLNLGNYNNDFNYSNNNFTHSGEKSLKVKNKNNLRLIDPRIKELQNLEHLSLEGNSITDIENVDHSSKLVTLELGGNIIKKISGLYNLLQLKALFLYSNQIEKIEGLEKLINLEFLYLGGNLIQKLEGLLKLVKIREIYLQLNSIRKLEGVNGLKNLSVLELAHNRIRSIEVLVDLPNLTYLSLNHNELQKIEGIEHLKSLQELDLENNQIKKLEGLDILDNLILLHLENNQIEELEGLEKLEKLQELDLQNNKIKNVDGLNKLISLTKLNLSRNDILSSNGILELNNLSFLKEINFKQNPFSNDSWLNQEILEAIGNDKDKFLDYLSHHHDSRLIKDYIPPLKIILLGNSEDGKTSLALKLIRGWDTKRNEVSTHGLKIRKWRIDKSRLALVYDFGGQDYYHASYNMFFTWNTGYILVWDAQRQESKMIYESRNNNKLSIENQYRIYPCSYWLGNIEYWKKKKNLVPNNDHNQINTDHIKLVSVQNLYDAEDLSVIRDAGSVNFQLAAYLGPNLVAGINNTRRNLVKETLLAAFSNLFISPYALTIEDITILKKILNIKKYQVLSINEFKLNYPSASSYLLKLLHDRGILLYYEKINSLNEYVWLTPPATSTRIFRVLRLNALKNMGRIQAKNLKCEENLKLLMLHQELLFEHFVDSNSSEFIIPSYLPYSPNDDALLTLATTDIKSGFSIRFKDYIPHGMMARLICRLGKLATSNCFYRDLLIFSILIPGTNISVKVWIKVDFGELKLDVKSNVNDKSKEKLHEYLFYTILLAYWNENHLEFSEFKNFPTEEVNASGLKYKPDYNGERIESIPDLIRKDIQLINLVNFPFYLSLDGDYFLNYLEDLGPETDYNPVQLRLFRSGNKSNAKEEYRAAFNAFTINKKREPKKLFISYSSKDGAYMKRFTTHLEALQRAGLVSYWVDRFIETGTSWVERIRKEMISSDFIIYLLSPDFLATSYIMDVELPLGLKMNTEDSAKSKLEFIQLLPCSWKQTSSLSKNQQLLDNEALGKDMIIVNTHDNDTMWMKVIDNLVNRIENMQKIKI